MSKRMVSFSEGNYYHIYNRGNSKQSIFHDQEDYEYFMWLLYISNNEDHFAVDRTFSKGYFYERGEQLVAIGAYCLMPNHFHILITQIKENGISRFMHKISTAYAMYLNSKNKRTGSLFEGRYKAQHIDNDTYLKYIYSYIHLNPVKLINPTWKESGIKDIQNTNSFLHNYKYSSYIDYAEPNNRDERRILNPEFFPKYFVNKEHFKKEIFSWLKLKHD